MLAELKEMNLTLLIASSLQTAAVSRFLGNGSPSTAFSPPSGPGITHGA